MYQHIQLWGFSLFPVCVSGGVASDTDYIASKISLEAIGNEMQEGTAGCKPCSALWKGQTH